MKCFVVVASTTNPAQQDEITNYVKNVFGFWHWIPGFWVLMTTDDNHTSQTVRNTLRDIVPGVGVLVLAVKPVAEDWAAWGPPQWGQWFNDYWK
jgi:hypothetical protein